MICFVAIVVAIFLGSLQDWTGCVCVCVVFLCGGARGGVAQGSMRGGGGGGVDGSPRSCTVRKVVCHHACRRRQEPMWGILLSPSSAPAPRLLAF